MPSKQGASQNQYVVASISPNVEKTNTASGGGYWLLSKCHQPRPHLHSQRKNWPVRSTDNCISSLPQRLNSSQL